MLVDTLEYILPEIYQTVMEYRYFNLAFVYLLLITYYSGVSQEAIITHTTCEATLKSFIRMSHLTRAIDPALDYRYALYDVNPTNSKSTVPSTRT